MKKLHTTVLCLFLLISALSGCGKKDPLDPNNPVTLTMWHHFIGDMRRTMDALIDEFNATTGKERGIIISVEAIAPSYELQQSLYMILNGDPGAPNMPDLTTEYPMTAIKFYANGLLANLDDYFTEEELASFIPSFLEEGRFDDRGLYLFPIAKSTEILCVNQTLFDRFAAATGVTMDCFDSFEGIADAAVKYYNWTDAQTPDIPDDGKHFYTTDSWVNKVQAGMLQQGTSLFDGENFALDNDAFRHIWNTYYVPSVRGGIAISNALSFDLFKTGDIVCSNTSSAWITFHGDYITYPDGSAEYAEFVILPSPVFAEGDKIAIQRGSGLMVSKSDPVREYAASVFIKWFTDPQQNVKFSTKTGFLPVTQEAFEINMPDAIEEIENPSIKQTLKVTTAMYADYNFFILPAYETLDGLVRNFENQYKDLLTKDREIFLTGDQPDPGRSLAEFKAVMEQ